MKKYLFLLVLITASLLSGCGNVQQESSETNLSAIAFAEKIKELPNAIILDVRTPDEFAGGRLQNAVNIDVYGDNFQQQVSKLDKNKPVLIYCLSGARSASAAQEMRNNGFKEVYELNGGIMSWRANSLPETTGKSTNNAKTGITKQQFVDLTNSDKLVLVDFYADWCAPCKQMEPYINEIASTMIDKVEVIRINADENPQLCAELGIEALPTLQLYKQKTLMWNNVGFIEKDAVLSRLN